MCKTDSALVPERPKLEDIIALAHPLANVVILNGNADDENYAAVCSKLEHHDWDFNEEHDPDHDSLDSPGPKCHLCGQEIWDISNPVTVGETIYSVVFTEELANNTAVFKNETTINSIWKNGLLQCVYCFNYVHINRCNITISDNSYFNILLTKNWACPSCVPIFICNRNLHESVNAKQEFICGKLFLKLARILNPLRMQYRDIMWTMNNFAYRYEMLHNVFYQYEIG